MKKVLILVDLQKGFLRTAETKGIQNKILGLLQKDLFDIVIATKFHNYDNSIYEQFINWDRLKSSEEQTIDPKLEPFVDFVVNKTIYTCVNPDLLQRIRQMNGGSTPKEIYLAGVDTDCCVLKTATDFFENGIRPVVLTSYCASNGGKNYHEAGILALKRLIGSKQLISNDISNIKDLENV